MQKDTRTATCAVDDSRSNSSTLDHLYSDYRDRLLRFVLARVGEDQHAAEDIVQESFTAALVSLTGFRSQSSHYTWLCSIAQHKIADHYRRRSPFNSEAAESTDPDDETPSHDNVSCSAVEAWFETEETKEVVRQALRQLSRTHEEVLRLKYFDGISVIEISSRLGRSPKAVEGLLARARRSLLHVLTQSAVS